MRSFPNLPEVGEKKGEVQFVGTKEGKNRGRLPTPNPLPSKRLSRGTRKSARGQRKGRGGKEKKEGRNQYPLLLLLSHRKEKDGHPGEKRKRKKRGVTRHLRLKPRTRAFTKEEKRGKVAGRHTRTRKKKKEEGKR